jgi:hypothetical protein
MGMINITGQQINLVADLDGSKIFIQSGGISYLYDCERSSSLYFCQ